MQRFDHVQVKAATIQARRASFNVKVYYDPSRQQAKAFKSWCPRLSLTPKREEKKEIPKEDQFEEVEDNPNVIVA